MITHQSTVPFSTKRKIFSVKFAKPKNAYALNPFSVTRLASGVRRSALGTGASLFWTHHYWLGAGVGLVFRGNPLPQARSQSRETPNVKRTLCRLIGFLFGLNRGRPID